MTKVHAIMSGRDQTLTGHMARAGLSALEPFYHLGTKLRNKMFDSGLRSGRKLPRPVISVGNITTGGTGKTPMVIELAHRLLAMGQEPAILTRGYGGDEKQELASALQQGDVHVPIGANPDRFACGSQMLKEHPKISAFLLDDGFQHRQLARDLDLVLIDATEPFGYGYILPRGMLREAVWALRRADAIILTRVNQVEPTQVQTLSQQIKNITGKAPIAHAAMCWQSLLTSDNISEPLSQLTSPKALGVCGVGNPAAFEKMLHQYASNQSPLVSFADHHPYEASDLEQLISRAKTDGCPCVVTTEKDWVKWKPLLESASLAKSFSNSGLVIYRAVLGVKFTLGGQELNQLIQEKCAPHK
jgi:tetraacyldisaccharide 4'-kinase